MKESKPKPELAPTAFGRFADLARRIVAVPKSEIQRKERTYKKQRRAK